MATVGAPGHDGAWGCLVPTLNVPLPSSSSVPSLGLSSTFELPGKKNQKIGNPPGDSQGTCPLWAPVENLPSKRPKKVENKELSPMIASYISRVLQPQTEGVAPGVPRGHAPCS
jgi:hypothetical protein